MHLVPGVDNEACLRWLDDAPGASLRAQKTAAVRLSGSGVGGGTVRGGVARPRAYSYLKLLSMCIGQIQTAATTVSDFRVRLSAWTLSIAGPALPLFREQNDRSISRGPFYYPYSTDCGN